MREVSQSRGEPAGLFPDSPNTHQDMTESTIAISVKVELFGTPRIQSGRAAVELSLPFPARRQDLVFALAEECPTLVGHGLKEDLSDLEDGYVFNRNGLAFLGVSDFKVENGDCILLISSQAGG